MARHNVTYGCGCGFKTRKPEEATAHSDSTHHTITVIGTIVPDVQPLKSGRPGAKVAIAKDTTPRSGQLDDLRKKFSR